MKRLLALMLSVGIFSGCSDGGSDGPPVPPWPEWAFHHWVWEDESTQESAIALIDGYIQNDIPVGAIIIDSPWETGYNTFEWDSSLFPDPQAMIDYFHSKDVRVFLWITSAINIDMTDLYAYAESHDYFLKADADSGPKVVNWWKGDGSFIDYFNPEAVEWWHSLMDQALDMGIDGWKCDGLDFQSMAAPYSPGLGGEFERIEYSHAYYRDFFDYSREKLGNDRIITARPVDNYGVPLGGEEVSFAPRDINWAGWVGDQDANFGGLKAALMNFYYSSEMNYIAFGSDIGGYRENDAFPPQMRSKELLLRWAQMGAFCPIMENGGGGIHHPWAFDQETVDIYRKFVKLHHAMIPYLMEEGARAFENGWSLMTFFDNEPGLEYHYLLGPDILVAPMLEEGTSRTVDFPAGSDWIYLFDKTKTYTGGSSETLTIPLDEFPVFLREGSEIAGTLTAD